MKMISLLLGVVLTAGCSAAVQSPTTTPVPSVSASEPASAFVFAAQAFLRYACEQPGTMESAFCTDVNVDGLTVEGDTLTVPTAAATDRLADICEELVGSDLLATATAEGVVHVVVADESGEQAECEFASPR